MRKGEYISLGMFLRSHLIVDYPGSYERLIFVFCVLTMVL